MKTMQTLRLSRTAEAEAEPSPVFIYDSNHSFTSYRHKQTPLNPTSLPEINTRKAAKEKLPKPLIISKYYEYTSPFPTCPSHISQPHTLIIGRKPDQTRTL
jgi:hypothetical protein